MMPPNDAKTGGAQRRSPRKKQTRFTYVDGPVVFIAQQMVRLLQDAGWSVEVIEHDYDDWRQGHPAVFGWAAFVGLKTRERPAPESPYWQEVKAAAAVVSEKYGIELDLARARFAPSAVQITYQHWRRWRDIEARRGPDKDDLKYRFKVVLPKVWKQYTKAKAASPVISVQPFNDLGATFDAAAFLSQPGA